MRRLQTIPTVRLVCLRRSQLDRVIKVTVCVCRTGSFNVLTTSLVPPRPEFKLRELDKNYVEILKNELLRCPLSFAKPLIGIVKGLKSKEEFDENVIDTYEIEIIGGNHRRQALTEITREEISRETKLDPYEQTTVQLYSGKLSSLSIVNLVDTRYTMNNLFMSCD